MTKTAQLVSNIACENATNTYNKLLVEWYGLECITNILDRSEYIENILHMDLLKSGIECPKNKCNA